MRDIVRLFGYDLQGFDIVEYRRRSEFVPRDITRNFSYLKRRGYLRPEGADRFTFSDSAKIKLLGDLVALRKEDGKKRVVIFDIPESERWLRDVFRGHMKTLGFVMLQRSVWVSKLPCEDLVSLLAKHYGVVKYTRLVVGDEVSIL